MSSKKTSHTIEYAILRFLEGVTSSVPRRFALSIGAIAGDLLYRAGGLRNVVRKNMEFVGYDAPSMRRIMPALYRNMGRYAVDFVRISKTKPPYTFDGTELLEQCRRRGKGTIAVLSHLGGWEILALIFGNQVWELNVVAMPMNNPLVEQWLSAKRERTGVTTIMADHGLRKMLQALKNNGIVAILIDQYAWNQGTLIPFLGRETSTVRTVAGLLHRTDCSIVLSAGILDKDGGYRVLIEKGRDLGIPREPSDDFIAAYQREHNDVLSRWIRQYPEHYFGWFHRRFRENVVY